MPGSSAHDTFLRPDWPKPSSPNVTARRRARGIGIGITPERKKKPRATSQQRPSKPAEPPQTAAPHRPSFMQDAPGMVNAIEAIFSEYLMAINRSHTATSRRVNMLEPQPKSERTANGIFFHVNLITHQRVLITPWGTFKLRDDAIGLLRDHWQPQCIKTKPVQLDPHHQRYAIVSVNDVALPEAVGQGSTTTRFTDDELWELWNDAIALTTPQPILEHGGKTRRWF